MLFARKFTGQERASESSNDNFKARYYGSSMGRFLSPDPLGGHFMNPQSLNRYAYVHNNPLAMVDPTGEDCVYTQNLDSDGTVSVEQGDCTQPGGNYVNGTIDTNSLQILQGDNGQYSLNYGFTSYDTGNYTLSGFGLPGYSPMSSLGGFGFGSPNYVASLFSQVANNPAVQGVSTARGIASFYAASAATGAAGLGLLKAGTQLAPLLQEYGPQALGKLTSLTTGLVTASYFIAQNPDYWNQASDFLNSVVGKNFGPVPATWGGIVGAQLRMAKDLTDYVLEQIAEGVPH